MSKTEKNLADAFAGESQANRKYLAFAAKAEKEGFTQAAKLFRRAAEKMDKLEETDVYVCQSCGHTVEGEPPDKCPICNSPKKSFKKIG